MPRPTRESLAIDHIADIYGEDWLVSEYRPTDHGFDIALGWPLAQQGPGNPRVITTLPLLQYLHHVIRPRDIALPIGKTSVKRLRAEMDLRWDWDAWWAARTDDLRNLTLEQFCAAHQCSMGAASQRRAQLLGKV